MKESIIAAKSFSFAIRIIHLRKYPVDKMQEYDLSRQLLRSGTAVGALIEESLGGESKADFIHKLSIAYKECRETHYWLRLLKETDYLSLDQASSIIHDCEELLKIIVSILKSSKNK